MTAAGTHYERAFEAYLQHRRIPYVAVDQARKAVFAGVWIKSFDFIIYPRRGPALLADVKGRKFTFHAWRKAKLGPRWVTRADVAGLQSWQKVFGPEYQAVFLFAYWLTDAPPNKNSLPIFSAQSRLCLLYGQPEPLHLISKTAQPQMADH